MSAKGLGEVEDALNRFAQQTQGDNRALMVEFKNFNKRRVDDFVHEPFNAFKQKEERLQAEQRKRRSNDATKSDIAGIFEYDGPNKYKPSIADGAVPEYSRSMGPRTRFGDGDGSFWDKWVGAGHEKPGKGLGYDNHRIPLQAGMVQPKAGFKRYYKSLGGEFPQPSLVKSYSQRRAERLEREKKEREGYVEPVPAKPKGVSLRDADWDGVKAERKALKKALPPISAAAPKATKPKKLISSDEDSDDHHSDVADEPDVFAELDPDPLKPDPSLSFTEREIYFGDRARAAFFDAYRHISRQQNILSGLVAGVRGVDVLSKLGNTTFEEIEDRNHYSFQKKERRGEVLGSVDSSGDAFADEKGNSSSKPSLTRKLSTFKARKGYQVDDSFITRNVDRRKSQTEQLEQIMNNKSVADAKHESLQQAIENRLGMNAFRRCDSLMVERKAQETHLTRPEGGADAFLRPGSPRTRYLTGCLVHSVAPRPNLIIRKEVTSILNIEYQYIGDTMAVILANSLEGLPYLTELNVAGNKLTDVGLTALINALPSCPTVDTVNFSENKIDSDAARALSDYISSSGCNIEKLIMRRSDIDDDEIDSFVLAVERCKTMRHLDLGENRIGSNQSAGGHVDANKKSGGAVLASLLENSSSKINTLKVPWNVIRFSDAVTFTRSIRDNICLTHLDISFNAIGEDGGMALGDALHTNKVLSHLNIANNSITPAAAFTIATGILSCRSLKEVDMSNNPIAEDGGRAIMMVAGLIAHETKIDIGGCTLHGNESSSWFNILKPRVGRDKKAREAEKLHLDLPVPYDRAVCLQLLRVAATDEEFSPPELKYIPVARVDGRGVQDIEIFLHEETIPDKENASFSWLSTEGIRILTQLNTDPGALDLLRMGFRMVDKDNTGHLGPWQMLRVVQQVGFKNGSDIEMLLKQLFILHAVSSASLSGSSTSSAHSHAEDEVTCEEVVDFFTAIYSYCTTIKPIDTVVRFYHENENAWNKEPYIPHDMGSMEILLSYAERKPRYTRTISATIVQNILETAAKATDISKAIEFGLSHCKLQFQDAQIVLKELLRDTGNKVKALASILPKLASPNDVKWFQGFTLSFNSKEQHLVKAELGGLYHYLMGCFGGYYNLFLNQEADALCLVNLIRRAIAAQLLPCNEDLVSASSGGLIGFRNVLLDGQSTVITPDWLREMPNIGRVEFDFVDLLNEKSDFFAKPISDWRFMQAIDSLELCCKKFEADVLERLNDIRMSTEREARARLLYVPPETSTTGDGDAPVLTAAQRRESSADVTKFYWRVDERSAEKVLDYVDFCIANSSQRDTAKSHSKLDEKHSIGTFGLPGSRKSKHEDPAFVALNSHFVFSGADSFGAHKAFATCPKQSVVQVAGRLIDSMTSAFGDRVISCAQLAILVLLLPFKALKRDAFATFRIELIIRLYSNLCDKYNFDRILRLLFSFEYGILLYRIGSLTLFSAVRPQGNYMLALGNPEDRLLARVLLQMQKEAINPNLGKPKEGEVEIIPEKEKAPKEKEEKLLGLWTDVAYQSQEDRAGRMLMLTVPGTEWDMPPEWECSAGFPSNGVLKFHYLPGPPLKSIADIDLQKCGQSGRRVSVLSVVELPEIDFSKEKKK